MKDRTILAIKGLAIIGVVTHHLINRRQDHHITEWLKIQLILFAWCVIAFVAISGYLHAWSDTRREKGVPEFALLRFNRLLAPWLLLIFAFSCIWQTLQICHVPNIGVKIPAGFIGKIAVSIWPVTATVGEQLYYFPILFGASMIFILVKRIAGIYGIFALVMGTFIYGVAFFPKQFTGFLLGVFVWCVCFYAVGYLLFKYREKVSQVRMAMGMATLILIVFNGYYGFIHSIPLWLLAEGSTLRLGSIPGLASLGEAAGTIFIYHTPFIIQPLVIASTYLHGPIPQFLGAEGACAMAIFIFYLFYHLLKNTRAKFLLM